MKEIYRVLENFVDKIFAKKILAKVIKTALIIIGLLVFFYGFNVVIVDYLILGLLFCLLYILTFHLNEFLKKEEEYLKKIFSKEK
ncbi:MAG: hypothetical protein AB7U51_11740 [Arcobacter sp.]|uniref:hypothetical protein n=1 Tax=Arcobacter sp. TaxID=1872629 RepID=UPI003D045CD9